MSDPRNLPTCIGIILDGNRRWARANGLPEFEGHRRGYDRFVECTRWVRDRGIKHLAVYVFSTENWNRKAEEVSYLMNLLQEIAQQPLRKLAEENIRLRFVGKLEMLPQNLQEAIVRNEAGSKHNDGLTVWVCMSYGSRQEITAAAQELATTGQQITEQSLQKHLWTADMPDPDLIIRPGGEKRLSNFLLWQAAYSELFFIDSYWPDFSETILDRILEEYATRERRMGR
ncbi:MAG TPA: polyprenyl diphosphate synthase [Candidatus Paceibacterota bacterium]